MAQIKVIKKAEQFSEKKLRASLKKVGAIPAATKAAVEAVKKMLKSDVKMIESGHIRKTVSKVLAKLDKKALKKYNSFRKKK